MKAKMTGYYCCPVCRRISRSNFGLRDNRPQVVLCDSEEGGCDNYFVVSAIFELKVEVFRLEADDSQGAA